MRIEKLKSVYTKSESITTLVVETIESLDEKTQIKYKRNRRVVIFVSVLLSVMFVFSTTVVALKTDLFGLYSEKEGKYGLNVKVDTPDVKIENELKNVKLKLEYIPQGYQPVDGDLKYTYNGEYITDRWSFSFQIEKAEQFEYEGKFIVDSSEIVCDKDKIILMTRQFEYGGEKDYVAVRYFDEFGYVIVCHCAEYDELVKIIKGAQLVEDKSALKDSAPTKDDLQVGNNSGYSYVTVDEFKPIKVGDSFDFSDNILNRQNESSFTVRINSVEQRFDFSGLDRKHMIYDDTYQEFFANNGEWISRYTRTNKLNGDGVNSLDQKRDTQVQRNFYVVTMEVTCNNDYELFSYSSIGARAINFDDASNPYYSKRFGYVDMIYLEPMENNHMSVEMEKGESITLTVGIAVDEEMSDKAFFTICKRYIDVNDLEKYTKETVEYLCVRLKDEVAYNE